MDLIPQPGKDRVGWLKLHRAGLQRVRELVAAKELRPPDVCMWLAMVEAARPDKGTVKASVNTLAAAAGISTTTAQAGLHRLERHGLVARVTRRRSRLPVFIVDPTVASSGGRLHQRWHSHAWFTTLEAAEPVPPPNPSQIKGRHADPLPA